MWGVATMGSDGFSDIDPTSNDGPPCNAP